MSFMKTKNNRGPKIDPWGTPDLTGSHDDSAVELALRLVVGDMFTLYIYTAKIDLLF